MEAVTLFFTLVVVAISSADHVIDCNDGGFFHRADPESCNHFYKCDNGVPVRFTCPEGTYYNTETYNCDWKSNVDCGSRPVDCDSEKCNNADLKNDDDSSSREEIGDYDGPNYNEYSDEIYNEGYNKEDNNVDENNFFDNDPDENNDFDEDQDFDNNANKNNYFDNNADEIIDFDNNVDENNDFDNNADDNNGHRNNLEENDETYINGEDNFADDNNDDSYYVENDEGTFINPNQVQWGPKDDIPDSAFEAAAKARESPTIDDAYQDDKYYESRREREIDTRK